MREEYLFNMVASFQIGILSSGTVLARMMAIILAIGVAGAAPTSSISLPAYEGRYYVMHTDLSGDDLREADLRMNRMVEEYRARTKDFSGALGHKFPFFLFRNPEDYYAAGGAPGSAGIFNPNTDTLMAIAGRKTGAYTWSVVQHEGFHQFARSVIGGQIPIWVNEGLAEYFGEGLFTGDGFVTGVIPPERLVRVKQQLRTRQFRPIKEMMLLAHADWNQDLSMVNYDQAWSMVQFLAHGGNGMYQQAFIGFMRTIATGQQWDRAWLANFGSAEGFEKKWRDYWLKLPDDPTPDLYARADTQTMAGALARMTAQKRKFASFDQFVQAAGTGVIPCDPADWLPPHLVAGAFARVPEMRKKGMTFDLSTAVASKPSTIVCTLKDGTKLIGRFTLRDGRVVAVVVDSSGRR
jgi:hypothetical protein